MYIGEYPKRLIGWRMRGIVTKLGLRQILVNMAYTCTCAIVTWLQLTYSGCSAEDSEATVQRDCLNLSGPPGGLLNIISFAL